MRPTTLRELATLLSLSPSTVSKALNDSPEISERTKKRVHELAKFHGYRPNQIARNLKTGKTKTLGVVIPSIQNDFFGTVLFGVEKEAAKKNYRVVLHTSEDNLKKERRSIKSLANGSVDGILISLAKETQTKKVTNYLTDVLNLGIPMVQFDRVFEELDCDKVMIDDYEGAYKATKYLIESGCRDIAFLSPLGGTSVGQMRQKGYIQALNIESSSNISPNIIYVEDYKDITQLIQKNISKHKIDGILAIDEISAVCAMHAAQTMGLSIPADISVIGFNSGTLARYTNPPLTTVTQCAEELGRKAVQKLIQRIENPGKNIGDLNNIIRTELTIRKSTNPIFTPN